MRSRTTLGFVLIIAAVLACSITFLLRLAQSTAEYESGQVLWKVSDDAAKALDRKDWKEQLKAISGSQEVAERNITIVVIQRPQDRERNQAPPPDAPRPRYTGAWTTSEILYQSRTELPPAPPRPNRSAVQSPESKAYDEKYDHAFHPAGPGRVVITIRPKAGVARDMARRRLDMLMMGTVVVLGVGFGAWILVGLTLSPIRKLARQAASASAENLSVRLEPPSNDAEVVDLVDTLNGFLERIAQTAESKGRFYAAASHELRTPLQALSGHLELALSRERSAEDYRSALEEAKKQSGRLKSLVQSLLLLHQLENNADRVRDEVNLLSICRSSLHQLQNTIDSRGLSVSVDIPADLTVSAISNHAEILVRNLLENAAKYATTGASIYVRIKEEGASKVLEIFDECEPVPGWSSEKAYEAFYRPDNARNAKTGGNGLGLAICRAVAHADGWEFKADMVDGGFLVLVTFPGVTAEPAAGAKKKGKPSMGHSVAENPVS
jgi:signal transduction histidine kinase